LQLDGATPGLTAATFNIKDEDHTLGNALRWMVMKKWVNEEGGVACELELTDLSCLLCSSAGLISPDVEFCGYSCVLFLPSPSLDLAC
jgi:DNA-directed RNA polymerase I and III subunit RPAC2